MTSEHLRYTTLSWLSGILLTLAAYCTAVLWPKLQHRPQKGRCANVSEKADDQSTKECTTLDFTNTKAISPSFNYADVPAKPYRPWHDGPHHVTMGIKRMELDDWVEIDSSYLSRHQYKKELFREHPDDTVCSKPGSEQACFEALDYLVDFLPRRYPTMFVKTDQGIKNLVTGDGWDLARASSVWETHHPLQVMGLLTTEDWFVLQTDRDQQNTRLTAGAVCFPAGWRIRERMGMSLAEIHLPNVPHYATKLRTSMDRFFLRLSASQPYLRFNYAVTVSGELHHPESHHNLTPEVLAARGNGDAGTIDGLWLRVERQTLQRLPKSGAVLFGIRTYMTPMTEVTEDRAVAKALRTQVESYSVEVAGYKNKGLWWDVLKRHLDEVLPEASSG